MDWRIVVNFVGGIVGLYLIILYFRDDAVPYLRILAAYSFLNIFYFTVIYGTSMFGYIGSVEVTFFLRPFAGVLLVLAGVPFGALAILHRIGKL